MFSHRFVEDYINAVRARGHRSPLVPANEVSSFTTAAKLDDFLGYSIIPVTQEGALAPTGETTAFVAMPHVFRRTRDGCGASIDLAKARAAGLTVDGLGKYPSPRAEAQRRLQNLVEAYGLPNATAPQDREAGDAAPSRPAEPASSPQATISRVEAGSDAQLFQRLLQRVRAAFERSDVKRRQESLDESWHYSICALPLRPGQPLLLGLNWGADRHARHTPQLMEPQRGAFAEVQNWNFIRRSDGLLRRYFAPVQELNYLNVCPFRSPDTSCLTESDWKLAIEEFFLDALDALRPPRVLLLGASGAPQLGRFGLVTTRVVSVDDNGRSVNAHVGTIRGRERRGIPFFALPHPNNKISSGARDAIWAEAFREGP